MSFILDALKKSEAERQRQSGPTLLELRVTEPRRRYPAWALIVGALLVLNVMVLVAFLLRRPGGTESSTPAAIAPSRTAATAASIRPAGAPASLLPPASSPSAPTAAESPPPAPLAEATAPVAQVATLAAQAASLAAQAAAVAAQVRPPAAGPGVSVAPLVPAAAGGTGAASNAAPGPDGSAPSPSGQPSNAAAGGGDAETGAASRNPADYLPAVPAAAGGGHVSVAPPGTDYSGLPSLSELSGNVPALELNLLDYSDQPDQRYALINMHRVHEGDVTTEGAHVLAITRQGVALDFHGQRFLLRPATTVQ